MKNNIVKLTFRTESRLRVFLSSGFVIFLITLLILCEKCTCLPKPITKLVSTTSLITFGPNVTTQTLPSYLPIRYSHCTFAQIFQLHFCVQNLGSATRIDQCGCTLRLRGDADGKRSAHQHKTLNIFCDIFWKLISFQFDMSNDRIDTCFYKHYDAKHEGFNTSEEICL